VRGDYSIHARLKRLEHKLGPSPQAAFAAEFRVVDGDDNERALVYFDETAPAAGGSVEDFVLAMDQLVAKAYAQLAEKIRALPPAATPG
jgi:ABC-type uncharacterized transport system auxiliary subunit